jgi:hypothetical protein
VPDAERGVLVGGVRITNHGERCNDITDPPLVSGVRLPKRLGGGFLYHNGAGLYFSATMAGALVPVFSAPGEAKIKQVSLGPSYVLLHLDTADRIAWSPKERRRVALPLPGLFDVAALDDGRAVMWLEPNRLLVRGVGAQHFVPTDNHRIDVEQLQVVGEDIWLRGSNNRRFKLEPSGKLVQSGLSWSEAVETKPPPHWRWAPNELPRELAMKEGIPIGGAFALLDVGGSVAKVDLGNGDLLRLYPVPVAGVSECQLWPMNGDVLDLCRTGAGGSVVIAHAASEAPYVERSFVDTGRFFAGEPGTLLKEGNCDGPSAADRYAVCIRLPSGRWAELSMPRNTAEVDSADAGVAPGAEAAVGRWIPTPDGGALGVQNGTLPRLIDLRRHVVKSLPAGYLEKYAGFWSAPSNLIVADFRVTTDGTIEGYAGNVSLRLTRDSKLESSPDTFARLWSSGAFAVALDPQGRLWQSTNYGRKWSSIALPPGQLKDPRISSCSLAGCDFGGWFRIGYPETGQSEMPLTIAPRAESSVADLGPQLRCFSQGPISRRIVTIPQDRGGNATRASLFGASWIPLRPGETIQGASFVSELGDVSLTRGSFVIDPGLSAEDPWTVAAALARPTRLRYREPFNVPVVRETSFTWQAIYMPVTQTLGQEASIDYSTGGTAVPVLSRVPGKPEGVVLQSAPFLLWLRSNKPYRVGVLPPELGDDKITSAAVDTDGNLLLAVSADRVRIVKSEPTGMRVLSEAPQINPQNVPNPDALAVAADGSPAILRIWSHDPPTVDDPALVLGNTEPRALAPWSSLTAGNCEATDGYRAIVVAGSGWLRLNLGGAIQQSQVPFLAMVHWNQQRVCLEAVEFPSETMSFGETDLTPSLVARFGAGAFAHRYVFDDGVEYTEPFDCQLVAASQPAAVANGRAN